MKDAIVQRLNEIEKDEKIRILYACESGSRAWGFSSPDSDYDIRFIYIRTLDDYLSIKEIPDTLVYPVKENLDFCGWDLKKYLFHLSKSNGVMFEWLQSPLFYLDREGFRENYNQIMHDYFNPRTVKNHYIGLIKRTLDDFGDELEVKLKKYFYFLRPLLAARWIRQKKCIPPMDFVTLLSTADVDEQMMTIMVDIKRKHEGGNQAVFIPRIGRLESFAEKEIRLCDAEFPASKDVWGDVSILNQIFRKTIMET